MKSVKRIELVLENCECIEAEFGEDFTYLDIGKTEVNFRCYGGHCNKRTSVEGITIVFTSKFDPSRLIKCKDVTDLVVVYEDSSEEQFSLEWPPYREFEYFHPGQELFKTEDGNYIFVSEFGEYQLPRRFWGTKLVELVESHTEGEDE